MGMLSPELALDLLQEQVQVPTLPEGVLDPELAPGLLEEKVPVMLFLQGCLSWLWDSCGSMSRWWVSVQG